MLGLIVSGVQWGYIIFALVAGIIAVGRALL